MSLSNTETSYGSITKIFHWTTFLLVALMLVYGYFMDDIANKILRGEAINLHKLIGLFILVLVFLRSIWTAMNVKPRLPANTPVWEKFAERVVHYLLYAMLFLMPISGWVMSSASGRPPKLYGVGLGLPLNTNKALSNTAFDVHYEIAIIIIVLVCVHASAAFYHYLVKKDDVLQRMLPD